MAKERKKFSGAVEPMSFEQVDEPVKAVPKAEPAPKVAKVKFLVWFTGAMGRFKDLKAHHMGAIQSFFSDSLKLGEVQTEAEFDIGLEKFGFGRK
jgi:hypothetical protein